MTWSRESITAPLVRNLVVDANDGIIATAGIVEGFAGAGATGTTIVIAAFSAMMAGGISLGGAKYAEEAAEIGARQALIDEERRQLDLSPHEEMAELASLYEKKGLSSTLAAQVASELSAKDALAAHVDAEHGLSLSTEPPAPMFMAVTAGLAYAAGSAVPLLAAVLSPEAWRVWITFLAVLISLGVTSLILVAAGGTNTARTLARSVAVGMIAMLLTLTAGALIQR